MSRKMVGLAVGLVVLGLVVLGVVARPAWAADEDVTDEMIRERVAALAPHGDDAMRVYWKSGLQFETRDKRFTAGLHGRLMLDYTFFADQEDLETAIGQEIQSGFQFRRAWLMATGKAWDHLAWMAQYAFDGSPDVGFLDVWGKLVDLDDCVGCGFPDVQIGHYQEPFGLAWLTSSKYFMFTAWPTPTTTFTPGYNTGVTLSRNFRGDRITTRLGFFGAGADLGGDGIWEDGYGITGRVTWLPIAPCDDDCRVFHVGLSASYRGDIQSARFRSRTDYDLGPSLIDTGVIPADSTSLVDVELAWVNGPISLQGEWMGAYVDATSGKDPFFWGAYLQASYLIGAPCRNYSKSTASFGQVKVCRPVGCTEGTGAGAWELALRYSYVDLDDGSRQGGTSWDVVAGVNWWWNENMRIMFNVLYTDVENAYGSRISPDSDGDLWGAIVRFQVHW